MAEEVEQTSEPEVTPRAHGTFPIAGAQVGTTLDATAGNITSLLFTAPPSSYEVPTFDPNTGLPLTGYFCLVDNGVTPNRVIFNLSGHTNGGFSPHPSKKVSGINIPFTSLYVQSCPKGATYSVTTG
jgi:hypothetical protein